MTVRTWWRARACAACLLALGLGACKAPEDTMYLLYNYSGKPIMAATVADTAGGHGAQEGDIPDQYLTVMGPGARIKGGASVTIEWIAGAGRARWYQATVPILIEQSGGTTLEIYLRPDQLVCASLVDDAHASNRSDESAPARVKVDSAKLSCARPVELPRLARDMARGFKQDAVSHSWELYDHAGTSTATYQTLAHDTGPVQFRYGRAFKGGPWYLNEFYSVRMIGKQAAWLVKAPLKPADPGMFVVTGDAAGWRSRFLGRVGDDETRLSDTRVLVGSRMVVDTATADIFMFPHYRGIYYQILGLSKDGKYAAVYFRVESQEPKEGAETALNFTTFKLEDGSEVDSAVSSLPSLPAGQMSYEFYGDWYRDHCDWTPRLSCK